MGNEVSGTTTVYNVEDLLNADEDNQDDADDHDNEDKSSQSSHSSTATIAVGSLIGVIAAVAAAVGLLNAPGVRETVLSFAPAPLSEQLEKFL